MQVDEEVLTARTLRVRRRALQLTQAALADYLAVTVTSVARWERGEQGIGHPERVRATLERLEEAAKTQPNGATELRIAAKAVLDASPHNLPAQLSSFVGRESDLNEIKQLLARTRLLTVTGAGGIGKTRIVLRAAPDLVSEYPDGIWLCELGPLTDPSLVLRTVAAVLDVRESSGEALIDTVCHSLLPRQLLLLLDNCEHIIDACAELAYTILSRCPSVRILATSREPLGVPGEVAWQLPSLPVPAADRGHALADVQRSEAVRLFVERATAALTSFTLTDVNAAVISNLCRRLDGIPLALELAAARVQVLSVDQIAVRIDDRFDLLTSTSRIGPRRHQTLRAAIEWSYDLLSEPERQLFRRLSVFAGGWTLEAAEAVAADSLSGSAPDLLEMLAKLVAKSLVIAEPRADGQTRYRLLGVLRQYGELRLEESHEVSVVRGRQAAYFVALAEEAERNSRGPQQAGWLDRLDREHDNIRVALRWLVDQGPIEWAERLAGCLRFFWNQRGHHGEGREWLTRILSLAGEHGVDRARALIAAGTLAYYQGDPPSAAPLLEQAVVLARRLSAGPELAYALFRMANVMQLRGEHASARVYLIEAIAWSRRVEQPGLAALCLMGLGWVACDEGAFDEARNLGEEGLALASGAHWTHGVALLRGLLGAATLRTGNSHAARAHLEGSVGILRAGGDRLELARQLVHLARVVLEDGDSVRAGTLYVEATGLCWELGDQRVLASAVDGCACIAAANGQSRRALRWAAAAHRLRMTRGIDLAAPDCDWLDSWIGKARKSLGKASSAAAWSEGMGLEIDEAVKEVLLTQARKVTVLQLTSREAEVTALVAEGFGDREIAEKLIISERTAHAHIRNILAKLGLHSRVQLATWWVQDIQASEPHRPTPHAAGHK